MDWVTAIIGAATGSIGLHLFRAVTQDKFIAHLCEEIDAIKKQNADQAATMAKQSERIAVLEERVVHRDQWVELLRWRAHELANLTQKIMLRAIKYGLPEDELKKIEDDIRAVDSAYREKLTDLEI